MRLVVRTKCVVVADLIALRDGGQEEVLLKGLPEEIVIATRDAMLAAGTETGCPQGSTPPAPRSGGEANEPRPARSRVIGAQGQNLRRVR